MSNYSGAIVQFAFTMPPHSLPSPIGHRPLSMPSQSKQQYEDPRAKSTHPQSISTRPNRTVLRRDAPVSSFLLRGLLVLSGSDAQLECRAGIVYWNYWLASLLSRSKSYISTRCYHKVWERCYCPYYGSLAIGSGQSSRRRTATRVTTRFSHHR